ncbi:MAG: TolC family protein [Polyangiaceae bacterium]|nr:TolC family protein [Polyangiaceae bacterium]
MNQLAALYVPGGMTADQAARRAIEVGPTVRQAEAAVAIAEAGARQARLAFFPDTQLSYRYTRLSDISLPPSFDVFKIILDQHQFEATATLPVTDMFLTILPSYRSAQNAVKTAEFQIQSEHYNVALRARETYYEHLRALGSEIVARQAVEQALAHQAQVTALVNAGASARVELYRVDAALARARVNAAQADLGVRTTTVALRALLDLDADVAISIGEDLESIPERLEGSEEDLLQRALSHRVEVQALEALAASKRLEIRARGNGRLPQVAVQGAAVYADPNQRYFNLVEGFRGTWSVSAIARWSPNDAALAQHRMRAAQAELVQIEGDMERLSDSVRVEVAQAYHGYTAARAQLEAATAGVQAAEESYRVRFAQLRAGAAVTSDLLDAQTDLNIARLELVNASTAVRLARARLIHAVGEQR